MVNAEKLTESTLCPSCGAGVEPVLGAGRPRVYCSETCRRTAEFRIRALGRRLDKNEVELRELQGGSGFWSDDERRARLRMIKVWLAADYVELRALLGQTPVETIKKQSKNNQK